MKSGFSKIFPAVCLAALFAVRSLAAETNSMFHERRRGGEWLSANPGAASRHAVGAGKKPRGVPAKRRGHGRAHPGARTDHRRAARRRPRDGAEKPAVHVHAGGRVRVDGAGGGAVHGLSPMALGGAAGGNRVAPRRRAGVRRGRPQLAAPGRATVEISNARLLDIVGQLEKKILELESGGRLLAEPAAKPDPLAEGQTFLDANEPQKALECFENFCPRSRKTRRRWSKKRRRWKSWAAWTRRWRVATAPSRRTARRSRRIYTRADCSTGCSATTRR